MKKYIDEIYYIDNSGYITGTTSFAGSTGSTGSIRSTTNTANITTSTTSTTTSTTSEAGSRAGSRAGSSCTNSFIFKVNEKTQQPIFCQFRTKYQNKIFHDTKSCELIYQYIKHLFTIYTITNLQDYNILFTENLVFLPKILNILIEQLHQYKLILIKPIEYIPYNFIGYSLHIYKLTENKLYCFYKSHKFIVCKLFDLKNIINKIDHFGDDYVPFL